MAFQGFFIPANRTVYVILKTGFDFTYYLYFIYLEFRSYQNILPDLNLVFINIFFQRLQNYQVYSVVNYVRFF